MPTKVSTVLAGDESLCLQCAELLLDRGHTVLGVVTSAAPVREWAKERGIPVARRGAGLAERVAAFGTFDYLLSIANLSILSDEVLALPSEGSINFHDGPLPRYAGLYCTSWALLNAETSHGVTWHLIEGAVDEGRVLAQGTFEIDDDETALTLNAKCYAAGIDTFDELLGHMEAGTVEPVAQDLAQRSYFARNKRPDAMATIDPSASAQAVVALVRALDFGAYANPLSMAKLSADQVALVGSASIVDGGATHVPGTVVSVSEESVQLACADGVVELSAFRNAEGAPATPSSFGFRSGERLSPLTPEFAERLSTLHSEIAGNERFWASRLALPSLRLANRTPSGTSAPLEVIAKHTGAPVDELVTAVCVAASRLTGMEHFSVGYVDKALSELASELEGFIAPIVPLSADLRAELSVSEACEALGERLDKTRARRSYPLDLIPRTPSLNSAFAPKVVIASGLEGDDVAPIGAVATFFVSPGEVRAICDESVDADAKRRLRLTIDAFFTDREASIHDLPILSEDERTLLVGDLARTAKDFDRSATVHGLFEVQAERTPDRVAVVCEERELTYAALEARSNQLAHRLRERGVERGSIVGLHIERSLDMVVAMLGIQKAGGAYLPLDPEYPRHRLIYVLEDSKASVVVADGKRSLLVPGVDVLTLSELEGAPTTRIEASVSADDLAYVIYTSGSTGRPKGVMVEHRNVTNFFAGMDERVGEAEHGVWLAVTSPSFDISVLELGWTLARGFTVLVHRDRSAELGSSGPASSNPMDFGLCYWGNDDAPGRGKYKLLLEGAKLADENGFHSVWTPERHFHAFGGPYANPAVSGAAVAAITKNVDIRSCSCVLPLHHPVRVAEEWAMIDNMSDGRVGMGIAAGWQPDDFVLRPENTPPLSKEAMYRDIEVLRRLWRGEEVEFPTKDGTPHAVVSQPRPVQPELPIWLTIALNPDSFVKAAEIDANVLTHLLGQSVAELDEKIQLFRNRRAELGLDPHGRTVTLMLHTFVDSDREVAREVAREPLKAYLASAASLIKQYVWMFPALKRPHGADAAQNIDLGSVSAEDMDAVLEFAFTRYFEDSGLLGSIEDAVARVDQLKGIGVDEVGCLIDYGIDADTMLASFPHLFEVVRRTSRPEAVNSQRFEDLVANHKATHMQCTPSMARMLLMDSGATKALGDLEHVMIGGEALPPSVVRGVGAATDATITNMYGPTETTIWSSTDALSDPDDVTIGTAIANTALYVLDARRRLVPPGVTGELWIGGEGVTRGYLHREELTKSRFMPDPFAGEGRMYRTGDLARRREDGKVEFQGRVDHQVKFRGYRIELGEIETRLEEQDSVRGAVVVARDVGVGEAQLVAYVVGEAVDTKALRTWLVTQLPAHMVPGRIVSLDRFPLTPNGKVDRAALPDPATVDAADTERAAPKSEVEQTIAKVWQSVLGLARVGLNDNFFDLGGHSLLAVRLLGELNTVIDTPLKMTDIFRFPTIAALVAYLGDGAQDGPKLDKAASRASARRKARQGAQPSRRKLGRRS